MDEMPSYFNAIRSEMSSFLSEKIILSMLDHVVVQSILTLATLWVLFSDDIRLYATNKSVDNTFGAMTSVCFFVFVLEIILNCVAREGYFRFFGESTESRGNVSELIETNFHGLFSIGSFYFWLDLTATIILIVEIPWIVPSDNFMKSTTVGIALYQGMRIGRYVRLVRLLRILIDKRNRRSKSPENDPNSNTNTSGKFEQSLSSSRASHTLSSRLPQMGQNFPAPPVKAPGLAKPPLIRATSNVLEIGGSFGANDGAADAGSSFADSNKGNSPQSRVGAAMSELTSRRVNILVMVLVIIFPIINTVIINHTAADFSVLVLQRMGSLNVSNPSGLYKDGLQLALMDAIERQGLLRLELDSAVVYEDTLRMDALRRIETHSFSRSRKTSGSLTLLSTVGYFDVSDYVKDGAFLRIFLTLFVWFILQLGTYWFTNDVNCLVIFPIEQMVELVQRISKNPLAVEYKMPRPEDGFKEGMETTMLLQTINKIGGLMRVCFGEAGASIIARNLVQSQKHKLNLMGPGNMVHSIFGYCDIRRFTDTTECLQEEVMLFVNRIAYILHGIVVKCSGCANKNIGDAFLLTWKIDDSLNHEDIAALADQALLTYCRALVMISRHHSFICDFSPEAYSRLMKRFPNYKVRIGCGLHVGWAIEGAIGSHRKIDASYLSPHVNLSEYLESSTKKYGVALLLSEQFFRLLSPTVKAYCRMVDRIKRKESEEPFGLFTYDADVTLDFSETTLAARLLDQRPPPVPLRLGHRGMSIVNEHKSTRMDHARNIIGNLGMNRSNNSFRLSERLRDSKPSPRNDIPLEKDANDKPKDDNGKPILSPPARIGASPPHLQPHQPDLGDTPHLISQPSLRRGSTNDNKRVTLHTAASQHLNTRKPPGGQQEETSFRNNSSPHAHHPSRPAHSLKNITQRSIHQNMFSPELPPTMETRQETKKMIGHVAVPEINITPYESTVWETDDDLRLLRRHFTPEFKRDWDEAMQAYLNGDWLQTRAILSAAKMKRDSVANFLLQYLEGHGCVAPEGWAGYRAEYEE